MTAYGQAANSAAAGDPAAAREPADQAERDRVTLDVGETMFVVAGAGTGKTRALVERVTELIVGPSAAPIGSIAAITFTEKAAAELRNRIRAQLNRRLAAALDADAGGAAAAQAGVVRSIQDALDGLDSAAISTLHGFARRILSEHAVEAALPPKFETLDQIASDVRFEDRWTRFGNELLSDPKAHWAIALADAAGAGPAVLRDVGRAFNANWDLVRPRSAPEATSVAVDDLVTSGRTLAARRIECSDPADKALARFAQLDLFVDRLDGARTDAERVAVLRAADDAKLGVPKLGSARRGSGSKDNWPDVVAIRERFASLREACTHRAADALDSAIRLLCDRIARFTLDAAEQRRRDGTLEYHDLLVRARSLLRSAPEARAALHRRYRHLLLDEFQDTDPIQVEIAALIAADSSKDDGHKHGGNDDTGGDGSASWDRIEPAPGQLFFVGDPKQSIYRFRRADISLYLAAQHRFGNEVGGGASLQVNFRTAAPIIDWINATFDALMPAGDGADTDSLHAPYAALQAWRPALDGSPAMVALGAEAHDGLKAEQVREAEAADVAAVIGEAVRDGWPVEDRHLGAIRPARLSDIAVLIPTRTCLPQLEAGLAHAGISYRLEASEFVWRSRTVRDLMMCLRAAADPDDDLAVVSALRTPFYGCGDDELYEYHRAIGSWSCFTSDFSALRNGGDHIVARSLRHLKSMYEQHTLVAPAVLADSFVRERRMLEQAALGPRTREVWRQLRYVIDQARAWSQSQRGSLRQFLRWVEMQSSERAKTTEAILEETDDDSVRVLTVHASKGLEFPIVIVAGLTGGGRHRLGDTHVAFDHSGGDMDHAAHPDDTAHLDDIAVPSDAVTPSVVSEADDHRTRCSGAAAVRLRGGGASRGFEQWAERDRLAEHHERVRLLYVACTRARDHLVVSLHRKAADAADPTRASHADLLHDAMPAMSGANAAHWDYRTAAHGVLTSMPGQNADSGAADALGLPDRGDWLARRNQAASMSKRPSSLSATRVARHGDTGADPPQPFGVADKDEPDDFMIEGQAPARRGRGATSVGRAVHGVLQAVDLATGAGLTELSAAQAVAEGVTSRQTEVERYVQSALSSEEARLACRSRHWREIYAAAPLDADAETVIEGYIDLMYEDPDTDGLVVIDYKTDALGAMPEGDSPRAEQYRRQCAAYAWCIERAVGRRVSRAVLLYLRADGSPAVADILEGEALQQAVSQVPTRAQAILEPAPAASVEHSIAPSPRGRETQSALSSAVSDVLAERQSARGV